MNNEKIKGTILIIFSALAFGLMPTLSKLATKEGLNTSSILSLRFIVASAVVWGYIFIKGIPFKVSKSHLGYLILISVAGYFGTALSYFTALDYVSSYIVEIILFIHPVFIVMFEIFFLKYEKDPKKIVALSVSIFGIILIVWNDSISVSTIGILLSLVSAVCYTFYILGLQEKRTKAMNPIVVTGYILLFSAVSFLLKSLLTHEFMLPTNGTGAMYILIFALVPSVLAIFAFCIGVRYIGASRAAIISTLEPVFATILGVSIFNEHLTLNTFFGGLLVISAIIILEGKRDIGKRLLRKAKS